MFDPTILLGNQMVRNFVCYILIEMGVTLNQINPKTNVFHWMILLTHHNKRNTLFFSTYEQAKTIQSIFIKFVK